MIARALRLAAAALVGWAGLLAGCLGPLADDAVAPQDVLPAGSEVPWASGALALQIEENDGVGEVVPRLSAFAAGNRVWYWDFGPAPSFVAPIFILYRVRDVEGRPELVDHPPVWDVVPGDLGYSPFWGVQYVKVTDAYAGERLTSRGAIDAAVGEGLVEAPEPEGVFVNCPVVARGTLIEVGGGVDPLEPKYAFYRGVKVGYFDMDSYLARRPYSGREISVGTLYALRRVNEALPLSEPIRQVDMTGDGDLVDTNEVFDAPRANERYSPVKRVVDVFVPANYESIDTSGSEQIADYRAEGDMFTLREDGAAVPIPDAVEGFETRQGLVNVPLQGKVGTL